MSASNKLPSFLATMAWEGGAAISMDPRDAGNWTGGQAGVGRLAGSKWGVSAMVAARLFPGVKMEDLTEAQALSVFVSKYWNPVGGDSLPIGLDHCVSDDSYNAGPANALKLLSGISTADPVDAIKAFSKRRLSFLQSLSAWSRYGGGWGNRVGGVEAESIKMAMGAAGDATAAQVAAVEAHAVAVAPKVPPAISAAVVVSATAPVVAAVGLHFGAPALALILGAVVLVALVIVVSQAAQSQRAAGLVSQNKVTAK